MITRKKSLIYVFLLAITFLTAVSIYFSFKKYSNFEFGKFDLGNMNQMLHNSSRGNFMEITDYYGSNVSRFSMSHVDFSIMLLIPFHYIFSDAFFLVVFQRILFFATSLIFFVICRKLKYSLFESMLISLLVFLMPISGFNLINASFHPLIFSLFFVPVVYLFATRRAQILGFDKVIILVSFLIILFSKEELGLVMACFSLFLIFKRKKYYKFFATLFTISLFWSLFSIFYLIPLFDYQRITSLQNFLSEMQIEPSSIKLDIEGENYFLYRYKNLGDSYQTIVKNLIIQPNLIFEPLLKKESLATLMQLFSPVFFVFVVNPFLFLSILPEIFIHGLSGSGEIFSIQNHRLTIIIPLLIISLIEFLNVVRIKRPKIVLPFLCILFLYNVYISLNLKSPLLYLTYDKILSILNRKVFANEEGNDSNFLVSQEQCANKILSLIPKDSSLSGPQIFGAKTSNRQINALFPSAISKVDYIVIDINEKKLANNLGISSEKLTEKALTYLNNGDYRILYSCNSFTLISKK